MGDGMEQTDYTKIVPTKPPDGLVQWLEDQGFFQSHVLQYKAAWVLNPLSDEREQMVELKCSGCGETMYAPKVDAGRCHSSGASAPFGFFNPVSQAATICGNKTVCPMCGCAVRVCHVGRMRYGMTLEEKFPMTVGRVEDKLVLTGWYASQFVDHDGKEHISARHYEAYVFEKKKTVRLMGHIRCMSSVRFLTGWEQRKTCLDNWGQAPMVFPWDKAILEGTTVENSKLDLYMDNATAAFPVSYLRLWQKHPQVENLLVQGCGRLVGALIKREAYRSSYERAKGVPKLEAINWKEKRPSKMLGLTGEEFQCCRTMQWSPEELAFYLDCKNAGLKFKLPEDLVDCINTGSLRWCARVRDKKEVSLIRAVRYLKKQSALDRRADAGILEDYWNTARLEGYDMWDEHVRYPKDLMRAHDRVVKEKRDQLEAEEKVRLAAKYEKWRAEFAKRLERLSKFAWTADGILIRPAETPEELDMEGKILSHCVAGYKDTHAGGEKAIFFIRRESAPEVPWYTLELNMKTLEVCQNRGKANCARTSEVEAFEQAWLAHIKTLKPEKKKAKRGKAA